MENIKLLMLNYEFPPIGGGAGCAHLCLLKEYANQQNLTVDVLTSGAKPGLSVEQFSDKIKIHRVGVHKKDLHYWRRIEVIEWLIKAPFYYKKLIAENDYDLVHAFFGFPSGWLCWRTAGKLPYIISLRGSDVPGRHARLAMDYKIIGPVFKSIWKKADVLVACSKGLKERALKFLPSAEIETIPNGVDTQRFYPAEHKNQTDSVKLLTVGRLSVTKRTGILIDAVDILRKQGLKIKFAIAGGGNSSETLKKQIRDRDLGGIIDVMGRVDADKMPQLYRQCDIFISATMQEGMSNAMLEAMASGLPIVTTRCEGVDELITDNGVVLAQDADAASLAEAIKKLINNKKLLGRMSLSARQRAEQFSWRNVAEKYLRHYECIRQKKTEV